MSIIELEIKMCFFFFKFQAPNYGANVYNQQLLNKTKLCRKGCLSKYEYYAIKAAALNKRLKHSTVKGKKKTERLKSFSVKESKRKVVKLIMNRLPKIVWSFVKLRYVFVLININFNLKTNFPLLSPKSLGTYICS